MQNKGGCLGCKYFEIEESHHYSTRTWDDGHIGCMNGIWSGHGHGESDMYQDIIVRGGECAKYEQADHVKD